MTINPCPHGVDSGAYVLGALSGEEREAFERHLLGCGACRDEVADLRVAAAALPVTPPPLTPSPALKERIMAVVDAEGAPRERRGAGEREPPSPTSAARTPRARPRSAG